MNRYQICTRCILDTTVKGIEFDEYGICNFCRAFEQDARQMLSIDKSRKQKLAYLVATIKEQGRNNRYDCVLGLGGGLDSSYVAYLAKKYDLKLLGVTVDNGWDTEAAKRNMMNVVNKLNIDLHTHTLDWDEFKDLQLSFLKASVQNIEIPTDHAIHSVLYRVASQNGIRIILSGGNMATEGILPSSFIGWSGWDARYIKGIHKRFGTKEIHSFPFMTVWHIAYYKFIRHIQVLRPLNYIVYNKKDAIRVLEKELGWGNYGGKHYESVFTRFFQGYILPLKFGVDKRRAHLSTLILSGQMTREEALEEIKKDPYPSDEQKNADRGFVIKKLGLTEDQFDELMALPIRSFRDYPSNYWLFRARESLFRQR